MKKKMIVFLFAIYIIWVLRITVFRDTLRFGRFFSGTINASLFREYIPLIRHGAWMRSIYLFFGNIVCFVPFGMYLRGMKRWKVRTVVLCGLLFSLCIETMQFVLGTGVSELDDLILNTFGVLLGALFIKLIDKYRQ